MKNKAAQQLGSIKSPAKTKAARENGKLGGRPSHRSGLVSKIRGYITRSRAISGDDATLSEAGITVTDLLDWMRDEAIASDRLNDSERDMLMAWVRLSDDTKKEYIREARK